MTKKTLYLNCIKNNCDPRKYGKGTIDNNREPNYIKRKRYHRYGLTRKGGNYFDNFIRSLNKMNDGGIRQPWTRLGRILVRWLERLTGYFYSGNSWPQRVLGNSLANELGTYISSIIEIVNTAMTEMFGFTPEQLLGQQINGIFSDGHCASYAH